MLPHLILSEAPPLVKDPHPPSVRTMTNSLLRSLAALLCVLSVCADVTPVANFDVTQVREREQHAAVQQN